MTNILSSSFINEYKHKQTPFYNYGLGEFVYKRTYARINDDNHQEEWFETIGRVVNGLYKIKFNHFISNNIKWNQELEEKEAKEMYNLMFNIKFLPGGRSLWAMGTPITDEKHIYAALNNCAAVSTINIDKEPTKPFEFLFDSCMLGIGVGFDTDGAGKLTINKPIEPVKVFIIEDSREGWVLALRELLNQYFLKDYNVINFDYSKIRPAGQKLRVFGGTSSGYEPLKKSFDMINTLLQKHINEKITSRLIIDIMNMLCLCVISGNVRRSASIAVSNSNDTEFMTLKNYDIHPERAEYGWLSNNSIKCNVGDDYTVIAEHIKNGNGEPGIIWLDNMREYSKMDGTKTFSDQLVMLSNPCGEISLEPYELCNLTEIFINRQESEKDFIKTLYYAYMYAKIVSLCKTNWEETNKVIEKNRRLGISLTGIANFLEEDINENKQEKETVNIQDNNTELNQENNKSMNKNHKISKIELLRKWTEHGYKYLKVLDSETSFKFKINKSIKITCIKPSGTISLLAPNTCSGLHYPISRYYIRRVRINNESKELIQSMRNNGYIIEDSITEPNTSIINFVIDNKCNRNIDDLSMWEQLEIAAKLQEWWADNQVSCTISFNQALEGNQIKNALNYYQYRLKGITFLPKFENISKLPQLPYEKITEERYNELISKIKNNKINIELKDQDVEAYCNSENCDLKAYRKYTCKNIILMNGITGSGKSFVAKKIKDYLITNGYKACIVSKDDFRYTEKGYTYTPEYEKIVSVKYKEKLTDSIKNNKFIILDNTHISKRKVDDTIEFIKQNSNNNFKYVLLRVPLHNDINIHVKSNIHDINLHDVQGQENCFKEFMKTTDYPIITIKKSNNGLMTTDDMNEMFNNIINYFN